MTTVVAPCHGELVSRPVPHDLRVVVGVDVDEAGDDDRALGVDDAPRRLVEAALGDDPPIADADVGAVAGKAAAVDDGAVLDEEVEHIGWARGGWHECTTGEEGAGCPAPARPQSLPEGGRLKVAPCGAV